MMRRLAPLATLLGGCAFYTGEPAPDPSCADPEGCEVIDAFVVPALANGGTLTLTQTVTTPNQGCEVVPANPLVLTVTADAPQTVSGTGQVDVRVSYVTQLSDRTAIHVELDDWWGETFFVTYDLDASLSGDIDGTATASAPGCNATLHVTGTWHE
jgi:hypothetical protein